MHVQTHILSGWCAANLLPLTPRQRLAAMIAASAADLDGLGILFGQEAYWRYHHTLGHNLLSGLILSLALTFMTRGKLRAFAVFLGLFHLHLLMDFFGSGPGWPITYLWPFSGHQWNNSRWSWAFYSWQNLSAAGMLVVWTVAIARTKGRTPLEAVMPKLDSQLVEFLGRAIAPARLRRVSR
jgi:LexA-binding, inner membrane-associated putative hydrolase